jgi:O-antigen/teichoic acid export membrane protein
MASKNQFQFRKVLIGAAGASWVLNLMIALNGIVAMPIIVSALSKSEYGIWVAVVQTVSFLALSDFGMANAISRFVARSRGLENRELLAIVYSTGLSLLILVAFLAALLALLLSPWIGTLLKLDRKFFSIATIIFLIAAGSQVVQFPLRIGYALMIGHQKYGPHAIGKFLNAFLHLSGVLVLFVLNKITLINLAILDATAGIIGQSTLLIMAWVFTRPWNISLKHFSLQTAKEIAGLGSSTVLISASTAGYRSGISILLARFAGINALAIYGVVLTIAEHLHPFITIFSTPFSTIASELHARNRKDELKRNVTAVIRITFAAGLCLVISIWFFASPLLHLLLHKSTWTAIDYGQAQIALTIMCFSLAIGTPQSVSRFVLQGTGRHWYVSRALLISTLISIGVATLLLILHIGLLAAAIGWSMLWIFIGIVFFPSEICRFLEMRIGHLIITGYVPGLIAGLLVFLFTWGIDLIIPSLNIWLFIKIIIVGIIMVVAIIIASGYRDKVLSLLKLKIARVMHNQNK